MKLHPSWKVKPTCGVFWLSVVSAVLWEAQRAQAVLMGPVCSTAAPTALTPDTLLPSHPYRGALTHLACTPCPGEQQGVVHVYLIFVFIPGGTILRGFLLLIDQALACFPFTALSSAALSQRCSPCGETLFLGNFPQSTDTGAWGEGAGLPGWNA